jgi:hypothetical protein
LEVGGFGGKHMVRIYKVLPPPPATLPVHPDLSSQIWERKRIVWQKRKRIVCGIEIGRKKFKEEKV